MLGDRLAEGDPLAGAIAHHLERTLGQPDCAHAVVDATGPQAALRDLEAATFAQQDVARRDAHVLVAYFRVAVWRVVIAEHAEMAHDGDAGCIHRHQHHGLLRMTRRIGIGLAHDDGDLAARVHRPGAPPLAAVDHVVVALTLDTAAYVGGVG